MINKIVFLIIVFLSNIIQCITGFAGTVLAMPFSVMTAGYTAAKPILNVLGIAASVYIVTKDYKYVNKREFAKITAVMLAGIAAGNLIYNKMSRNVFLQLICASMLISGVSLLVK